MLEEVKKPGWEEIRAVRKSADISQEEMARRLSVSRNSVIRWERPPKASTKPGRERDTIPLDRWAAWQTIAVIERHTLGKITKDELADELLRIWGE